MSLKLFTDNMLTKCEHLAIATDTQIMEIACIREIILGRGQYGIVYQGIFRGKPVAVKRVQLIDVENSKIEEDLKNLNHPNVLKLLHSESDIDFR